ncbi:hypothetical protein BaRGS_00032522, partial [Batillaria attramentaria]
MQHKMATGRGMQGMALYSVPCFSVTSSTSVRSSSRVPLATCTCFPPDGRRGGSDDAASDVCASASPAAAAMMMTSERPAVHY